jgi:hypothetical protein
MISETFPDMEREGSRKKLLENAWNFTRIDYKVSADRFIESVGSDDLKTTIDEKGLTYIAQLYTLTYPLLDFKRSPALCAVRDFVASHYERTLLLIDTHGARSTKEWHLINNGERIATEEYLLSIEDKYSCIVCRGCNTSGFVPQLKKSALLFFKGSSPAKFDGYHLIGKNKDAELFYKLPNEPEVFIDLNYIESVKHFTSLEVENVKDSFYYDH